MDTEDHEYYYLVEGDEITSDTEYTENLTLKGWIPLKGSISEWAIGNIYKKNLYVPIRRKIN